MDSKRTYSVELCVRLTFFVPTAAASFDEAAANAVANAMRKDGLLDQAVHMISPILPDELVYDASVEATSVHQA